VRAKQRLSYERRSLNFSGLGGGFAPRQLRRSPPAGGKTENSIGLIEFENSNLFPCREVCENRRTLSANIVRHSA